LLFARGSRIGHDVPSVAMIAQTHLDLARVTPSVPGTAELTGSRGCRRHERRAESFRFAEMTPPYVRFDLWDYTTRMSRLRRRVVLDHGFFITYRWLPRRRIFSPVIPTGWAVEGVLLPTHPRPRLRGGSEENNLTATRWRGRTSRRVILKDEITLRYVLFAAKSAVPGILETIQLWRSRSRNPEIFGSCRLSRGKQA
jgi:hypothetical protein